MKFEHIKALLEEARQRGYVLGDDSVCAPFSLNLSAYLGPQSGYRS